MDLPVVLALETFREALQELQDRGGGLVGERWQGRLVVAGIGDHGRLLSARLCAGRVAGRDRRVRGTASRPVDPVGVGRQP